MLLIVEGELNFKVKMDTEKTDTLFKRLFTEKRTTNRGVNKYRIFKLPFYYQTA